MQDMSHPKKKNLSAEDRNRTLGGTLYLVATPIGNLSDLSPRALKVLSEVDFIAAEDTRNSGQLLSHFGISKPMVSYYEHNKRERGEKIAERLEAGESCALVTDAGTPAISDPGEDLVVLCAERGIPVTSIPGACAAVTALTVSALPAGRFVFEGFLSTDKSERRDRLAELIGETRTMIFYEAPHKLRATLDDLIRTFGEERRITLCREITKLNEEILRMTLREAAAHFAETEPKGEFVLILAGGGRKTAKADYPADPRAHVQALMNEGLSRMDALKAAARARGVSKSALYRAMHEDQAAEDPVEAEEIS